MTSQPDSDATVRLPDDENTADERTEKVPAADQPDIEATIAGPHAASETGNAALSDETHAAAVAPAASADPEMTLEQNIGGILEEFAQTLASEYQDLDQTLPHTSLKPVPSESGDRTAPLKSFTQTKSLRPRSVQSADQTGTAADSSSPVVSVTPGDSSLDYLTLDKLGEGGMGTVHLAQQVALGREVALKQIHRQSSQKQLVREEFLTEAVLTGKLEHPNIVPIYEVGESAGGELFYSMKNVKGRAWDETIDELTLDENLEILIDVCDAIAFSHAEGVIHRDLKPQNIMTGGFGEVLVLDWGLAVLAEPGEDVKASGAGTPSYMAPEMINPPFVVGPRSDVYLLGAILFRFLTGTVPHAGKSAMSSLQAVSRNEIVTPDAERIQDLDPTGKLLSVAMQAMATAPADRYQTVGEFQQAVREFETHQESLELAARAEEALKAAGQSGDYTQYSRSMIGFEEAVTLWAGNATAKEGIERSRQAYALCAEQKEDYELGLSLLDESNAEQRDVIRRLTAARDERDARQGRLKRMKQSLAAAAALTLAVVTVGAVSINQARIEADRQRVAADNQRTEAENQRKQANAQRSIAVEEKNKAEQARIEAEEEREKAKQSESRALASKKEALRQKDLADRRLYLVEMNQAGLNWESGDVSQVRERLDAYRPDADPASDGDLRGFEWKYWDRLCNSDQRTFTGHTGEIWGVAFSPDGTHIASASEDMTIKLWDVITGQELFSLEGHSGGISSVEFSPDGKRLASASNDKTVKLWDVATGQETANLTGHNYIVMSVTFSPDGKRIASGGYDRTIRLWDTSTGKELHIFEGHVGPIWSVSFSPDGAMVASASWDGTVKLWDVETGQETATLTGHAHRVVSVAFSPDSTQIASGSWDKSVKLWDVATGEETASLTGHKDTVLDVAFSRDGTTVGSVSADRSVKLWDVATTTETATLIGHTDMVAGIAFSPDGARIASASHDKTVKLWDPASGRQALTLSGHKNAVWGVAFSPNGRRIASASFDKTVKLWDAASGQETATLTGHTNRVDFVAFSPDSTRLASASWDGTVKLWDVDTARETATLTGHTKRVYNVAFSPDGATVASASEDMTIKLWDVATGQDTATLTNKAKVVFVTFSPDGDRLASSIWDGKVKLWDVDTGRQTATLSGHTATVFCVAFGPNGNRLASASNDKTVKLWDVATGRETANFIGHTGFVMGVAFSPDGLRVASASGDSTVKLWDVVTGRETATFTEHTKGVRTVAFSPDGLRVVSGGFDNTVKVWDARPWTPELKVQYETRGYLTYHTPRSSSGDALQKAIQADQTINDQVRQQALDWSELFRKNYAQQQLDRAHQRSGQLFLDSWGIVKQPELSAEQYQTALEMAAEANSLRPDHGKHMQILGIAQFRAQKYKESLATLIRCENPDDPASVDAPPYGPVFIAMTRFQLGEQEQAADLLNKIKAKADQVKEKDPQGKRLDLFIKEAESLIHNEKKSTPPPE